MKALIIGEGFGARIVAPAFRQNGVETEIVSPRNDDAVKRACASKVDLVAVHSPPHLHRQHVMWALDGGHPVLCDKPFGRNADDARAMRDRARAVGALNFLNFE